MPILLAFSFASDRESERADFLIVPRPLACTILNQYQQSLTEVEKKLFAENTPVKIIATDQTLGDQITHVVKVSFLGKTYFLQKDENGKVLGADSKNQLTTCKNCLVLNDTIEILAEKAVPFGSGSAAGPLNGFLRKKETVIRLFQYEKFYYVQRQDEHTRFGWCSLNNPSFWRRQEIKAESSGPVLTGELQARIEARIQTVNNLYRQYFEYFNAKTGRQKSIPVWQGAREGTQLSYRLSAPYGNGAELSESTQSLVRELQGMLLGKHCTLTGTQGVITIAPERAP